MTEAVVWGLVLALDKGVTQYYRGCLLLRFIDHNAGLRGHPAEVSLEASRHADRDHRCADVWLFDGVLVRGATARLGALLGRREAGVDLAFNNLRDTSALDEVCQPMAQVEALHGDASDALLVDVSGWTVSHKMNGETNSTGRRELCKRRRRWPALVPGPACNS